jgi:hypothetical protein
MVRAVPAIGAAAVLALAAPGIAVAKKHHHHHHHHHAPISQGTMTGPSY